MRQCMIKALEWIALVLVKRTVFLQRNLRWKATVLAGCSGRGRGRAQRWFVLSAQVLMNRYWPNWDRMSCRDNLLGNHNDPTTLQWLFLLLDNNSFVRLFWNTNWTRLPDSITIRYLLVEILIRTTELSRNLMGIVEKLLIGNNSNPLC